MKTEILHMAEGQDHIWIFNNDAYKTTNFAIYVQTGMSHNSHRTFGSTV